METQTPFVEKTISPLEDALLHLELEHPALQGGRLKRDAGKSSYKGELFRYPDPELTLQRNSMQTSNTTLYSTPGYQKGRSSGMEVKLAQPIPFPGKLTMEAKKARVRSRIEEIRYSLTRNRLAGEFLEKLSEAVRLQETLFVTKNFYKQVKILADVAESRYRTGKGNLSDVSRAKLRASGYEEKIRELEGQLEARVEELAYYLTGEPEGIGEKKESPLRDRIFRLIAQKQDLESLIRKLRRVDESRNEQLLERSLEVKAARLEQELREKNETLAKMEYLPDFAVFAGYGRTTLEGEYMTVSSGTEKSYSLGVTIRIPLWSALSSYHKVRENDRLSRSAKLDRRDTGERVKRLYLSIQREIRSTEERLDLYRRVLLPQADLALRSSRLAYETGRVDFSTLLDSFDGLYLAKIEMLRLESLHRLQWVSLSGMLDTYYLPIKGEESHESH